MRRRSGTGSSRLLAWFAAVVMGAASAGCSSISSAPQSEDLLSDADTTPALMTLKSASGAVQVELRTAPQPPVQGIVEAEIVVTRVDGGAPVDGLTVAIQPWMPAMNHGSVPPQVTGEGRGRYLVTNLDLFMAGLWELKTSFSGPVQDEVAPAFEVP